MFQISELETCKSLETLWLFGTYIYNYSDLKLTNIDVDFQYDICQRCNEFQLGFVLEHMWCFRCFSFLYLAKFLGISPDILENKS